MPYLCADQPSTEHYFDFAKPTEIGVDIRSGQAFDGTNEGVRENHPIYVDPLSEACLRRASLTQILGSMEVRGLVVCMSNQVDKRRRTVRVTNTGQAIIDKEVLRHNEMELIPIPTHRYQP